LDVNQRLEDQAMSERAVFWRDVVERQGRSGWSVVDFCRREGVSTASFYNWRRRLREADGRRGNGGRRGRTAFVPVNVQVGTPEVRGDGFGAACIEIVLPGEVTIRVNDGVSRETLVDVLAAVREAS
jgi:transposase-like protein